MTHPQDSDTGEGKGALPKPETLEGEELLPAPTDHKRKQVMTDMNVGLVPKSDPIYQGDCYTGLGHSYDHAC